MLEMLTVLMSLAYPGKTTKLLIDCLPFLDRNRKQLLEDLTIKTNNINKLAAQKLLQTIISTRLGMDLFDSLIRRHKIRLKSKKWYFRLFYHLIAADLVNAWLQYKRECEI